VHLVATRELPLQQRPPDALLPVIGAQPALEVDGERTAEVARRHHRRVADDQTGGVADGEAVPVEVHAPAGPPLGQVLGVGVLAGVVDLLGRGQHGGDRRDVLGSEGPGGEPVGQGRNGGHGWKG
jgi:hypothetical protein